MTIKTRNIADAAITTAKIADLTVVNADFAAATFTKARQTTIAATMGIGTIELPLTDWRIIDTSNEANIAGTPAGGIGALNSVPIFKRENAATDKQLKFQWAATVVIPIATDFIMPPDLDTASNIVIKLLMGKDGNVNAGAPVIAVGYFNNTTGAYTGDTNAGGNTAGLVQSVAVYSVTITNTDVVGYPGKASIDLIPAAHGNDAVFLYGAWVEYTRK